MRVVPSLPDIEIDELHLTGLRIHHSGPTAVTDLGGLYQRLDEETRRVLLNHARNQMAHSADD
jgi:hypothetical protein